MITTKDKLITMSDAAKMLKVSRFQAYRLVAQGKLTAVKVYGRTFVQRDAKFETMLREVRHD